MLFWYNDSLFYEGLCKVTLLSGKASVKFMLNMINDLYNE